MTAKADWRVSREDLGEAERFQAGVMQTAWVRGEGPGEAEAEQVGASYPHSDRGHPHPPFPLEDTALPAPVLWELSWLWLRKDPAKGRVGQVSAAAIVPPATASRPAAKGSWHARCCQEGARGRRRESPRQEGWAELPGERRSSRIPRGNLHGPPPSLPGVRLPELPGWRGGGGGPGLLALGSDLSQVGERKPACPTRVRVGPCQLQGSAGHSRAR